MEIRRAEHLYNPHQFIIFCRGDIGRKHRFTSNEIGFILEDQLSKDATQCPNVYIVGENLFAKQEFRGKEEPWILTTAIIITWVVKIS